MSGSSRFHNVQIHYSSPGAQPPIFVAGSFTDPPWQPQELDYVPENSNAVSTDASSGEVQYKFSKGIKVAEGQWQYKFRLGLGDCWNEADHGSVTDASGNVNNLLTVKASRSPIRRPNSVPDKIITGVGNNQFTQNQEAIAEEKISSQMRPDGPMGNVMSRILDDNAGSHFVEGWNARTKHQGSDWPQVSQGKPRIEDEIPGNTNIKSKLPKYQNSHQEEGQEVEAPVVEESSVVGLGDDAHQHVSTESGVNQEGIRRRKRNGGTIPTSILDISDDPEPSDGSYGHLLERLVAWLYSIWAQLCGLGRR